VGGGRNCGAEFSEDEVDGADDHDCIGGWRFGGWVKGEYTVGHHAYGENGKAGRFMVCGALSTWTDGRHSMALCRWVFRESFF